MTLSLLCPLSPGYAQKRGALLVKTLAALAYVSGDVRIQKALRSRVGVVLCLSFFAEGDCLKGRLLVRSQSEPSLQRPQAPRPPLQRPTPPEKPPEMAEETEEAAPLVETEAETYALLSVECI